MSCARCHDGSRMNMTRLSAFLLVWCFGLLSPLTAQQVQDSSFETTVDAPIQRSAVPRIGFDAAHNNVFRIDGRSRKWAELMRADGYHVVSIHEKATARVLADLTVYVVATPAPDSAQPGNSAFSPEEIEALHAWVEDGGALLILGDHHPFDAALDLLARRFGARFSIGVVGDSANYDRSSANPSIRAGRVADQWIVFTRENGLLRSHAITEGRGREERIRRVLTFGGSSVLSPPSAAEFLALASTATNRARAGAPPSGMGSAQGIALSVKRGRVVITGDATMFTAQIVDDGSGPPFKLGMGRTDYDNRQLALNVMRWLSRDL